MQIYVVMGSTGAYEDFTEWMTEAYCDETKTNERVKQLELLVEELSENLNWKTMHEIVSKMREHELGDTEFLWFGTKTNYSVKSINLVDL